MKNRIRSISLTIFIIIAMVSISSCNLQKNVTLTTGGNKPGVAAGVLHPATSQPFGIGYSSRNDSIPNY